MKFSIVSTIITLVVVSNAAPLNNDSPTIWSQKSVTTLKAQINRIYSFNQGLYYNRSIFNPESHDCISPYPPQHYIQYNSCPNANKLATEAIQSVTAAWKAVAAAMFPVYYNQTDTAGQPRASFSDFSHYYSHLSLEIQSLQNTTAYYVCKGNFRQYSDTYNATFVAFDNNQDYLISRLGPITGRSGGKPVYANNGTDGAYPSTSAFTKGIKKNEKLVQTGWYNLRIEMHYPDANSSKSICKGFEDSELLPPKPPGSFP